MVGVSAPGWAYPGEGYAGPTAASAVIADRTSSFAITSSPTATVPTSTAIGDLLLTIIATTTNRTITPPAGWTAVDTTVASGGMIRSYWRIADGTESSTYVWALSTSTVTGALMLRITGADTSGPIDTWARTSATSTAINAPTLTAAGANELYIGIAVVTSGSTARTWTEPASMTEDVDAGFSGGLWLAVAYEAMTAAGATGTRNFQGSGSTANLLAEAILIKAPSGAMTGSASASSGGTGTLTGAAHLTGSATAAASASATLRGAGALTGSASGSSHSTGVWAGSSLSGSATGTSSASGQATGAGKLVGNATAVAGAHGTPTVIGVLQGDALAFSDAWGFVYGTLPPRITTSFHDRWQSGQHIGDATPQLLVLIRQGRFNRRYGRWDDSGFPLDATIGDSDPSKPWQAYWEPTEEYIEVPNVNSVELVNNFDQKGIASATITLDNIVYLSEAGGQHSINRGYLAPLRGYVADGRTPLVNESGSTVTTNDWSGHYDGDTWIPGKFSAKYQVTVYEGYGDQIVKTFTGLIDDVDATSNPAILTINARSFGQVLSDQEFFGWSIDKALRDPVVFIDKDEADHIRKGGYSSDASSQDPAYPPDNVNDGDSNTYWRSNDHTGPGNTEWVEIQMGEGRYEDFWLGAEYPDMDCYVSVFAQPTADGSPATRDGVDLPNGWVDVGAGTVPGGFGGIPYVRLISGIDANVQIRDLEASYVLGNGSALRVSFRNLYDLGAEGFRAAVRSLYSRKRTLVSDPGASKWVRVSDISDVIKVVLRWAGFKEWDVESTGAKLGKRLLANRGMKYMDLIDTVKDGVGYEFFVGDPTDTDESIGVPVFRQTRIVQPATVPVFTVTDHDLLTAVSLKDTDENKAYIIRTRGRTSKSGDPLGGDSTRRIMFEYRPPWSGLPMAGILRHVIHTNEKFTTVDDIKFAAWFIALQEAIESYGVDCEIPGYPGVNLDDLFILEDLGTGLTTRVSVRERRSTSTAGENRRWTMTLSGALVDVPEVQDVVSVINAASKGEE